MNLNTKLKKSSKVMLESLNDKTVLIDLKNGGFFEINEVALELWNMIDGESSINEIIDKLSNRYSMDTSSEDDCNVFIKKMIDRELLIIAD